MHKVSTMQMALISVFVVGALSGCAGGLEIPGLGAKKDPGSRSVGQPTAKTGVGTVTARSDTSAQSVREIGKPKPGIANREGTTTAHANRLGSIIQIASADTTNAGLYHRSYERSAADSPSGDRPPTGWIKTTASTGTTLGVPDRSLGTDGGDRGKWWEAMQASQRLDAERSRIARAQIAQGTAKPSGQSGATDLASANKEFNNPLTAATLFIIENDTVFLGGDLADGTKVTNITVIEPVIPVPLGNTGWALINRPILPIAFSAPIPVAGSGGGAAEGGTFSFDDHDGLGDFTFFSMLAPPTKGNFKFGFGPTFQFPTATKDELGSGKYSVGPAAVALYATSKFTVGLFSQSWFSFAGDDDRADVAKSTFQYFAFYNFTPQWGIGTGPIISVNWEAEDGDKLALPVGLGVTHTFRLGKFPARLLLEAQYYAVQRDSFGPEWNIRLAFGLFLPKLFGN